LEHEGKKICCFHGTDEKKLQKLIDSGKYDYVLTGHQHEPMDRKIGKTRVIRPGGFYLGNPEEWNQVVLLDVKNDKAEFIRISR
jgi:predicted phosphodiesterase